MFLEQKVKLGICHCPKLQIIKFLNIHFPKVELFIVITSHTL